ncbi:hypothetical protein BC567DRAFT_211507 [Phyllosticta citribraziliensis]
MSPTIDMNPEYNGLFLAPLAQAAVDAQDETAEPHISLFHTGYKYLLESLYPPVGGAKYMFMREGRNILAGMGEEMVFSIMDGTLPRYLVDCQGRPPTESELSKIAARVEVYISFDPEDITFAKKIDTAVAPLEEEVNWKRGHRRYVETMEDKTTIIRFIRAVRESLPSVLSNSERPRSLAQFAATNNAHLCFNNHQQHKGGSKLMYLVEAICKVHYPTYKIERFVVFRIWDQQQVWVGDILLNKIGWGYASYGFGFDVRSRFPCAADTIGDLSLRHYWCWEKQPIKFTPLYANYEKQIQLLAEYVRIAEGDLTVLEPYLKETWALQEARAAREATESLP